MEKLNDITVALPDTITIATKAIVENTHVSSTTTSVNEIWTTLIICLSILAGLLIVGHYLCKGIKSSQQTSYKELESRQKHELAKMEKEANIREKESQFDASQREIKRKWDVEDREFKIKAKQHDEKPIEKAGKSDEKGLTSTNSSNNEDSKS